MTLWNDKCPLCNGDISIFLVKRKFLCPHCRIKLNLVNVDNRVSIYFKDVIIVPILAFLLSLLFPMSILWWIISGVVVIIAYRLVSYHQSEHLEASHDEMEP